MQYSTVSALALILNLILNWELFKTKGFISERTDNVKQVPVCYNYFLLVSSCYFLVDISWGLLYERNSVVELFPLLYSSTIFYFIFMLLTMLTWTRFVAFYLKRDGYPGKGLLYAAWALFCFGLVCLMLNRFYHFVFSFNVNHEFIVETGRYVAFILLIIFYFTISAYMLHIANKNSGQQKVRYQAVSITSVILGVALISQILYAFLPSYAIGLMIGIAMAHTYLQMGVKKEKEIQDRIASAMAQDYEAIFYIEIESGEYLNYRKSEKYKAMNVYTDGKDFFRDAFDNLEGCVYPDDLEYAKSFYNREAMQKNLEGRNSFSFKYRLLINEEPRYFLFTVMRESSGKYFIFYEKDIDDELRAEKTQKENQKKTVTFGQIAESLASNYDVIYCVNVADSSYISYQVNNIYGQLECSSTGDDFFSDSLSVIPKIIYKPDCEKVSEFITKDNMISTLEKQKVSDIEYRIMGSGNPRYVRLTARKSSDGTHFILGVENIDDEVKREKQRLSELKTEKELARRDELTGVKNKNAYMELMESVQGNIDSGIDYLPFALLVCDTNNLKIINDTQGHAAGDKYIKASARILCDIFVHSPVFRIGGDEFVVFLRANDYTARHKLMSELRNQVMENQKTGAGVVLASGIAEYKPESDSLVSEVFERADKDMYEDKQALKAMK